MSKKHLIEGGDSLGMKGVGDKGSPRKNPQDAKIVKLLDDMFGAIKATNSNTLRGVSSKDDVGKLIRGFIYRIPDNSGYGSDISLTDVYEFIEGFDFPQSLSKYNSDKEDSDADGVPNKIDKKLGEVEKLNMAELKKNKIREAIKQHILKKMNEQTDSDESSLKVNDNILKARESLFDTPDQKITQSLLSITSLEDAAQLYVSLLDFINEKTPAPNIDSDIAIKYLAGMQDRDKLEKETEVEIEPETEEESVEEMSTTAGAPAPATKYAFKRKKK